MLAKAVKYKYKEIALVHLYGDFRKPAIITCGWYVASVKNFSGGYVTPGGECETNFKQLTGNFGVDMVI